MTHQERGLLLFTASHLFASPSSTISLISIQCISLPANCHTEQCKSQLQENEVLTYCVSALAQRISQPATLPSVSSDAFEQLEAELKMQEDMRRQQQLDKERLEHIQQMRSQRDEVNIPDVGWLECLLGETTIGVQRLLG